LVQYPAFWCNHIIRCNAKNEALSRQRSVWRPLFHLWNRDILKHIKAETVNSIPVGDESTSKETPQPDENWLGKAQQPMVHAAKVYKMNELVGKLYNLAKSAAIESEELL